MPKDEFAGFLTERLAKLKLSGEAIILPARYGIEKLEQEGVAVSKGGRAISGGFILVKDGIEQNNTFEALLGYYRDELEGEVLKILYD
jgi:V/A-type H+-transporting ATPase subunit E